VATPFTIKRVGPLSVGSHFEAHLTLGSWFSQDLSGNGVGMWSKFVRVRVEMEIKRSLVTGFLLDKENLLAL
jgi:hypothetical protein